MEQSKFKSAQAVTRLSEKAVQRAIDDGWNLHLLQKGTEQTRRSGSWGYVAAGCDHLTGKPMLTLHWTERPLRQVENVAIVNNLNPAETTLTALENLR